MFPIINNVATSPQLSIILRQTFELVSGPWTTLDLAYRVNTREGQGGMRCNWKKYCLSWRRMTAMHVVNSPCTAIFIVANQLQPGIVKFLTIMLEASERSPTESSPAPTLCVFCLDDIDIVSASGFCNQLPLACIFLLWWPRPRAGCWCSWKLKYLGADH